MSKKVYVGSLPENCKPESLRSLFESYGEITELDVMKNKNFGFVHFSNTESAQQAVDDLNDSTYEDKKIIVKISTGQKFNRDQRPPPRGTPPTKVYVGNLPDGFRREALSDLFSEYGVLTEVDVIKNFGFIHFELEIDALKAIKEKNKTELEGKNLEVKLSKTQSVNRDNRPPPRAADDRGRSSSTGGGGYDSSPRFHERRFNPLEAAGLLPPAMGGGGGRDGAANGGLSGMLAAAGVLNSLGGGLNSLPASKPRLSQDGTAGFVIYERYYVDTTHPLLKGLPIADLPRVSELQQRRSRVEDTSISGGAVAAPSKQVAADMLAAPAHSAYQYIKNSSTDADMRDPYVSPTTAPQREYPLVTSPLPPRADYAQSQDNVVTYPHLAARDYPRQAAPSSAPTYEHTSLTWRDRSPTR